METIFQPTPQELAIGTMVAVRLNERNRTPHKGIVADAIWHYKIGKWHYYLQEDGRKVHKRYALEDLEVIE